MLGKRLWKANQIAKRITYQYRVSDAWFMDNWRRYRKVRVRCSCFMCGHRRRYEGPTMQERKLFDKEKAEIADISEGL
jgi:hypothetical protein